MYAAIAALAAVAASTIFGITQNERNIHMARNANKANILMALLNMTREDNGVSRRVADLRAAGLSPTLAAGSAAPSNVTAVVKPPESDTKLGAENLGALMQALALRSQIGKTEAEREYIEQQMRIKKTMLPLEMKRIEANASSNFASAWEKNYNTEASRRAGLPSKGTSAPGAIYRDIQGMFYNGVDRVGNDYRNIRGAVEGYYKSKKEEYRKQVKK